MILHVDMDAFYASVEQLDDPKLKGKCVIVGGTSSRSVVSAASYEARKFGVHSAMPTYKARQMCPDAVLCPPRMRRYKELSKQIMAILKKLSPLVEPVSIDEAYVDIAGCERLHGDPLSIANKLKKEIRQRIHLNCSIGVAPNKFLAKIASDMDKPDGLKIIMPEEALHFIKSLSVSNVPGVGKKMKRQLDHLGIITLNDVGKYSEDVLIKKMGKFGKRLTELSGCIDHSHVISEVNRKSVSCEETLAQDTEDRHLLENYILRFSGAVGRELRILGVKAKTIILKIKHIDFQQFSRRVTLEKPTQSSDIIFNEAAKLLKKYNLKKKVRLIGVGASGFVSAETFEQMDIFNDQKKRDDNWERVDHVIDKIEKKYGNDMVKRASLRK
ncbi:MAG: DNA polymerase IV [Deltaproteobacteria bacterium]|nr:DNA polymerase IV [Deltaproteobacteria bacterium]